MFGEINGNILINYIYKSFFLDIDTSPRNLDSQTEFCDTMLFVESYHW